MSHPGRVIVGTAGHVDHGKTKLIEALTGIDCDRWAEEKTRGITIDLGFAHLQTDDLQIGFVDVPGHERFLHNALAGLGGIRVLLLVVAADQGVEPQTREHLEICSLLEIPHAVVALTKIDLVSRDLVELAQLEVEELLSTTPFAGAPIVPLSAVTGEGLDQLRSTLVDVAQRAALFDADPAPARLPIDRSFLLKGLGTIVTGTLVSGEITVGDELELLPLGGLGRVRSLQVHGSERQSVARGERVSAQVTGWELDQLSRGRQLVAPESIQPTHSLLTRSKLLPEPEAQDASPTLLSGWTPVRLHLFSAEVLGKMRPVEPNPLAAGEEGTLELRLDHPVAATRGDRFILRRPSPAQTWGGGSVLDPRWHRRSAVDRGRAAQAIQTDIDSALVTWVAEAGEGGAPATLLAARLDESVAEVTVRLEALTRGGRLVAVAGRPGNEPRWLEPGVIRQVEAHSRRVLEEYFAEQRLADTLGKAEAVRRILRPAGRPLADTYLSLLAARKVLVVAGGEVGLYGRTTLLTDEESVLAQKILAAFEAGALAPPSPNELARELSAKPQIFEGMLRYLVDQKRLVRLPGGLILATAALDETVRALRATGWERFDVPRFKDRFGLSRKWAIPILEHFDSRGVTRRLGNERQLVSATDR